MGSMQSLGMIAGNRSLPLLFARQARSMGVKPLVAVAFEGETDPALAPAVDEIVWLKVGQLSKMISDLLGTTSLQPVILVGVGNLGLALLSYKGFEQEGFEIIAAFDMEPNRKREKAVSTPIYPMERLPEIVEKRGVKMAILTVPAGEAQEVANKAIDAGVAGILNFAPIVLHVPDEVMVNNVNLAIELENLSYFIQQ